MKEGREGKAQIDAMMVSFRTSPPAELAGERVVEILDFQSREARSPEGDVLRFLSQASSNVMQFVTEAGSRITVRPSGTEPKIKCYASVREDWDGEGRTTRSLRVFRRGWKPTFARSAFKVTESGHQRKSQGFHRAEHHRRLRAVGNPCTRAHPLVEKHHPK